MAGYLHLSGDVDLDSTQSLNTRHVEQVRLSGDENAVAGRDEGTPMLEFPNLTIRDTPYTSADIDLGVEELDEAPPRSFFGQAKPALRSVESTNATRVALLVRKYVAGELSDEQEARLKLASERVNRLLARVTEEDFKQLEDTVERSRERLRRVKEIEAELGLES